MASKTKVLVSIAIDMIKIEPHSVQGFSSVLWCPFDDDTPLHKNVFQGTLAEIEAEVSRLADEFTPAAKTRCVTTGDKFNGFRITTFLLKGQRKPNGWDKSRGRKLEKQL